MHILRVANCEIFLVVQFLEVVNYEKLFPPISAARELMHIVTVGNCEISLVQILVVENLHGCPYPTTSCASMARISLICYWVSLFVEFKMEKLTLVKIVRERTHC